MRKLMPYCFHCGISSFILCTAFFLASGSAQERCKVDETALRRTQSILSST